MRLKAFMKGVPKLQHQNCLDRIVPNRRNRNATKIEPIHNLDERQKHFSNLSLTDNAISVQVRLLQLDLELSV